jgi:hypothetical protein
MTRYLVPTAMAALVVSALAVAAVAPAEDYFPMPDSAGGYGGLLVVRHGILEMVASAVID